MLRAVTLGMVDLARFDPYDSWCWRRLYWVLEELAQTHNREAIKLQHRHWAAFVAADRLNSESFELAKTNAGATLNEYLKNLYPWLADKIGNAGIHTDREEAVNQYFELYGQPDSPEYKKMVADLVRTLSKPYTRRDQDAHRKWFKEECARRTAAAIAAGEET